MRRSPVLQNQLFSAQLLKSDVFFNIFFSLVVQPVMLVKAQRLVGIYATVPPFTF